MRSCSRPDVPCHRVIAAGGRLGGYGGREVLKRALLVAEGIAIVGARVPLQQYRVTSSAALQRPEERPPGLSVAICYSLGLPLLDSPVLNPESACLPSHQVALHLLTCIIESRY